MLGMLTTRSFFAYILMPQVASRFRALFSTGSGIIPFFIATVYQMVGLLPANHPYLYQKNIGRYGIRHVMAEAANNLEFSLKNIDQVILYFAVLIGLILFVLQFLAIGIVLFLQPAFATALPTTTGWGMFSLSNANASQDLAYIMLDLVFGVPDPEGPHGSFVGGFFHSCISMDVECTYNSGDENTAESIVDINLPTSGWSGPDASQFSPMSTEAYKIFPFPYHLGIHRLFLIYSSGLLVVALGIASYFVATVLAETAQSGIPFGRRFNKTWAPLRIVVAFGLLVPLNSGLNSAQYLVLYSAKYGSAFATNAWIIFNDTLTTTYMGEAEHMVSTPNVPGEQFNPVLQFLMIAKTCKLLVDDNLKAAYGSSYDPANHSVKMYAIFPTDNATTELEIGTTTDYSALMNAMPDDKLNNVLFRFGPKDTEKYGDYQNFVRNDCGDVLLPILDRQDPGTSGVAQGPAVLQQEYFEMLRDYWHTDGWTGVDGTTATTNRREVFYYKQRSGETDANDPEKVTSTFVKAANDKVHGVLETTIDTAVADQAVGYDDKSTLEQRGWAAAGIWYNHVAELNGALIAAVTNVPVVDKYPIAMEKVAEVKLKLDKAVIPEDRFKPEAALTDSIRNELAAKEQSLDNAIALNNVYTDWNTSSSGLPGVNKRENPFFAVIDHLLGLNGLYNMRENVTTHPLAMMTGIGRSLVESSLQTMSYGFGLTGFAAISGGLPKELAGVSAKMFFTFSTLGLTVGFILFYVVPFLPFIYFFFAVGGWVKGIFEAMVGAPLWALAHIRIDNNGLPGNAALNGYYLIFEVFLRPILILFGLLASISTYSALVSIMNDVFDMVTANVGGYDLKSELESPADTLRYMRSSVDQFFYTVVYAIVVYMLGMASFKLIDMIPNNILRWMGQSVVTFNDQREDPAAGMVGRASAGSQQLLSRVGGGLGGLAAAASKK